MHALRSPVRLLGLVALLGVCGLGLVTQLNQARILYRSPYAEPLPWGEPAPPLSDRVVVALVDGLRLDTAYALEPLNALAQRGAAFELFVTEPTFSIPLSHVLYTGAPQTTIGVLDRRTPIGPAFYDVFGTIWTAAARAGLRTGNVVTWPEGYPLQGYLDAPTALPRAPGTGRDDPLVPGTLAALQSAPPINLLWVHFDSVDMAGHASGGASAEYREAAQRTAARIAQIAAAMNLSRETLIVTSDHGHLDRGGHGGGEPIVATVPAVLVGAGIAPGTTGQAEQVDLTATICWLLGAPIPPHNQGWPLVSALTMPDELRARRARDTAAERLAAYRYRCDRLGIVDRKLEAPAPYGLRLDTVDEALAAGQWTRAYAEAANLAKDLGGRWRLFLHQRGEAQLRPRIYAATGFGLFAFAASVILRKRREAAGLPAAMHPPLWLLAGVAVGILVPLGLYVLRGHGFSLSEPGRSGPLQFALPRFAEGMLGLAAGYAVARALAARSPRRPTRPGELLASVAGGMAAAAVLVAAVYLLGRGFRPQPWQTTWEPFAMLLVAAFQLAGVSLVAAIAAVVLATRESRDAVNRSASAEYRETA